MQPLSRRRFLELSTVVAAASALPAPSFALGADSALSPAPISPADRSLLLYIDPRLGADGEAFRRSIQSALASHPLLPALTGGNRVIESTSPSPQQLACNHVLLIALPGDPLLTQAWQREAKIDLDSRSIYAFGFGHLQGSVGYLEADRNPFLHSPIVPKAPYECEWISLTGTDRAGVALAVEAFLKQGLVNGLVAAPGWKRAAPTLLDRDPLAPGFAVAAAVPPALGSLQRVAITQVSEDEYRGALADAGVLPRSIWQAKYFQKGEWDGAGQIASFQNYAAGLHRRAYGNAVWAASFGSAAEAAAAAPRIAAAAQLKPAGSGAWKGDLPPYAWGIPVMGDAPATGSLSLSISGETVLLTSLIRATA